MARLINCRMADQRLVTITTRDGKIVGTEDQEGRLTTVPSSQSLDQLGDLEATPGPIDAAGEWIAPGLIDAHVHSRDPGLTHKETWATLARGAYKGGVVAVCDMPNTVPPTMDRASIEAKAAIARASGLDFRLFLGVGRANIGLLAELMEDETLPLAGIKVYYGQSTGELMYSDLEALARHLPKKPKRALVFHSEDQCAIDHMAERKSPDTMTRYEDFHVHSEIRSSEAAHRSTRTILAWAKDFGLPVHIAHLSTPDEVDLILEARRAGVQVTSEVAPHHLLFSTDDYARLGPFLKMNPPVRSPEEVARLRNQFARGLIEVIATDHAPHTREEKSATAYGRCPSGVPGVEFFLPLAIKAADETGLGRAEAIAMSGAQPARLFGFPATGRLEVGCDANLVWVKASESVIDGKEVLSKCGWTPYDGMRVPVRVERTWHRGRLVYDRRA